MSNEPQAQVYPRGFENEFPDGPPTAVIIWGGCRLALRFAPGDFKGEGELQELRLLPDTEKLEPRVLRQFAPKAENYLAYARAAMRVFGPEGTPASRIEDLRGAAQALRQIAGPGRRLSDGFYRHIAASYDALVSGGEPHPVKALSEVHHVTISAASRWLKEARRRGLIARGETRGAEGGKRGA